MAQCFVGDLHGLFSELTLLVRVSLGLRDVSFLGFGVWLRFFSPAISRSD